MNVADVLPNPQFLALDRIVSQNNSLTIHLYSTRCSSCCPDCGLISSKRHSFYRRSLADLPLSGRHVLLSLRVAKFFCANEHCRRKIFVERLPDVACLFARRTTRAATVMRSLALYVGGRTGAKLSRELALTVGKDTLLRQMRRSNLPLMETPRVLGVDDFAFRRGHTYGTILVDLERRKPIDLLPDRNAETLSKWLARHPGIEIVSRDRSPVYAEAIRTGAPAAVQVADRFHLLKNIFEAFERLLHRERTVLAETAEKLRQSGAPMFSLASPAQMSKTTLSNFDNLKQPLGRQEKWREEKLIANRVQRIKRYETVKQLREDGCSINEISRRLRMHRETVRSFLAADAYPERTPAFRRTSPVGGFHNYLHERWRQGCANARQLFKEIKKQGYKGCYTSLTRYLRKWRNQLPAENAGSRQLPVFVTPTPREVKWWLLKRKKLPKKETQFCRELLEQQPEIAAACRLVLEFQQTLKTGNEADFDLWRQQLEQSDGLKELKSFARGLQKDELAVRAAITTEWSNGQTEGQVNRLKLIKRSMYGRAKFDLLIVRVLFEN